MTRTERDTLGEVAVDAERLWGAQTQRSLNNFPIGTETMPTEIIWAFGVLKAAAARANLALGAGIDERQCSLICRVCDEIREGQLDAEFPLKVWQTGSGTQTNMNVNEVIVHRARQLDAETALHPNDHVNRSQSSNDTFPTAMRIAAAAAVCRDLLPAAERLAETLARLEAQWPDLIKCGRTHLQDAVPIRFAQEVSGWRGMLETDCRMIRAILPELLTLPLGGTAVGTGLGAPKEFGALAASYVAESTGLSFHAVENRFHALTSLDQFAALHGTLKGLASDLMKIANDIRWLASGPRCGLGELTLPANEPGSSIMPGKVNPTQCEALTMIAVQVMGNDAAVGFAASQGNFELNVFLPVTAYNLLQSVRLLSDGMNSFRIRCAAGLRPVPERMASYLSRSLMNVTALSGTIGYEKAARVAGYAHETGLTLPEAAETLGFLEAEEAEKLLDPAGLV